jgi:Secretion system C-terminal sorting domain/Fascin domain
MKLLYKYQFLSKIRVSLFLTILTISFNSFAQKFTPGANKTILLIGQTYKSEYQGYINGIGTKPAGSSHYGTLYNGTIEQGDDNPNGVFLDYVRGSQSQPYALVALSLKDNTAAGGYGQMVNNNASNFNSNAVHDALVAVNNGVWDAKIDAYANAFKAKPDVKFFVRIDYEVSLLLFAYNGSQYVNTWLNQKASAGINVFDNPDTIAELDRQAYINAYNRIANRIKAIATNVAFVYHPVRGFNDTKWLYPGDQNVDYVGFSIFNNDICMEVNGTFNCAGQTVDPNLQLSMNFAKSRGKAIMIAESAAQAPATGNPTQFNVYLDRLNKLIVANDVKVLSYINSNWPIHGWDANWGDSRVEINPTVKTFWNSTYLGSRYVQGGTPPPPPTTTPVGKAISLQNSSKYVSSENGVGNMNCNRTSVGAWERFTVVSQANGKVALKGTNGRYVSSENGTAPITCNRTTVGVTELFDLVNVTNTTFQLRGSNGRFVSSENGVGSMTCNRTTAGAWEIFNWAVNGSAFRLASESSELENGESSISIFPNPAENVINVKVEDDFIGGNLHVINQLGVEYLKSPIVQNEFSLNVSSLKSGVYVAKCIAENGKIGTKKLVIK